MSPRLPAVAGAVLAISALGGCAAGLSPTGKTVVGFAVGEESEALSRVADVAGAVAPLLPAPLSTIVGGIGLAAAAGGGEYGRRKSKAAAEAAAERAKLEGEKAGWDEAVLAAKAGLPT